MIFYYNRDFQDMPMPRYANIDNIFQNVVHNIETQYNENKITNYNIKLGLHFEVPFQN